jgi:hypothetical protein
MRPGKNPKYAVTMTDKELKRIYVATIENSEFALIDKLIADYIRLRDAEGDTKKQAKLRGHGR